MRYKSQSLILIPVMLMMIKLLDENLTIISKLAIILLIRITKFYSSTKKTCGRSI